MREVKVVTNAGVTATTTAIWCGGQLLAELDSDN
jgi:hypothetical protein